MGKVHGSLTRAGKVRNQTPKVAKDEKKNRAPSGRAKKRAQFTRRYVNSLGNARGPNTQEVKI